VLAGPVFNEIVSYGLQALEVPPTGAPGLRSGPGR
jgi:hypothetical protein